MTRKLVLASASAYRKNLLRRLGLEFSVCAQDVDESPQEGESAEDAVCRLAQVKARSCQGQYPCSAVIIGSDQLGSCDSTILAKPSDYHGAVRQLQLCSGRMAMFFTSVCLIDTDSSEEYHFTDVTTVQFRSLSDLDIEVYLKKEQPYSSCGSFQIEGLGISLVSHVSSRDPTALIGLPLIQLSHYLTVLGFSPLTKD